MSMSELAKIAGVSRQNIADIKKSLDIKNKILTKEDEQRILEAAHKQAAFLKESKEILERDIPQEEVKVRRIDQKDGSSLVDLLQDCKERYVQNEIIINRLNNELNQMEKLFRGNNNGTFQCMPQLTVLDKYQNMNYKLRTQIADFEEKLGKITENVEDDPFI